MNDQGKYLEGFARRTADTRFAKVIFENDDGSYTVEHLGTGARDRVVKARRDEWYAENSIVLIGSPSASRSVVGAAPMILSRAGNEQRGIGALPPVVTRETIPAAAVLSFSPEPLELVQGGEGGVLALRGHGFRSPATFDHPTIDGGDSVVMPELVTMHPSAAADAPLGLHSAVIDGVQVDDVIRVVEPLPVSWPTHSLWVMTNARLLRFDRDTMTLFASYDIPASSGFSGQGIVLFDGFIWARCWQDILKISYPSGNLVATIPVREAGSAGIAVAEGKLYYAAKNTAWDDQNLFAFDPSDGTETLFDVVTGSFFAGVHVSVWAVTEAEGLVWLSSDQHKIVKFDPGTSAVVGFGGQDAAPSGIGMAINSAAAWTYQNGTGRVEALDKNTLALLGTTAVLSSGGISSDLEIRVLGDTPYGTSLSFKFFKILSSFDTQVVEFPEGPFSGLTNFSFDDTYFFVCDNEGGVTRVSIADFAIVDRTVVDPSNEEWTRGAIRVLVTD